MRIYKFSATWCGPCKQLAARLTDFVDGQIEDVDIEQDVELVDHYRVQSVPTILITDNEGYELWRHVGNDITPQELGDKIKQLAHGTH